MGRARHWLKRMANEPSNYSERAAKELQALIDNDRTCDSTDVHLFSLSELDYQTDNDSCHRTKSGALGINVGGSVYTLTLREWHRLADKWYNEKIKGSNQ